MIVIPRENRISWWRVAPFLCLLYLREVLAVAVTEVRILSDSNRVEYVLHGEGVTLTCHYLLEASEKVTEVEWEKDGVLVYLWSVDNLPKAYDVLVGNVDTRQKSPSTLSILKAHMDMQGTYTCRVRTNGKKAHNSAFVTVIVDACLDDSWKTYTDMITCTETINMHCVGMFPKPSPACGVYSELTGKYLSSVPFDSVNLLWNRTYEISFNRRFQIKDWINNTDIVFRCYLVVHGTPWRTGIRHKMFGDPGCVEPPPWVEHGHFNVTDERSCWGHPIEGSVAEYRCDDSYQLLGSSLLVCREGIWAPEGVVVDGDYAIPVCSSDVTRLLFSWTVFLAASIAAFLWT